jgi:hypothetical protein
MARGLGGSEEAATNPAPERHRQEIGRFGEARSLSYLRASLEPRPISGISLAPKAFDGATSGLLIRAASIAIVEEETWNVRFHEQTTRVPWRVIEWGAVMNGLCWLLIRLWIDGHLPQRRGLRRISHGGVPLAEPTATSASGSPVRGERRGGAYRIQEEVP